MSEHQQETWAGVLLTALMIGRSYWLPGASVTTNATRAPRHALSRLCTLGINAKQPRENGSRTWAMPQWGRRHLRRRDQPPARGFPCPAQTPSPSASRAYSPRPGYIRLGPSLQACHRASLRYASVSALPQGQGRLEERRTGLGLPGRPQAAPPWSAALPPPQDGGPCLLQGATAPWTFAAAAFFAPLGLPHLRLALRASNAIGCVARARMCWRPTGRVVTRPSRRGGVLCCPSLPVPSHAWAMGSCDQCRPLQYHPRSHPLRGCCWQHK